MVSILHEPKKLKKMRGTLNSINLFQRAMLVDPRDLGFVFTLAAWIEVIIHITDHC